METVVPSRNLQRTDKGAFGSRWPRALVPTLEVPTAFEGLFEDSWLQARREGRKVTLREDTVVRFLLGFAAAIQRARAVTAS
jgi:hypothetical protein